MTIMLGWETERPDGHISRLTFEGELEEWMALCDVMPEMATNAMVRSLTKVCIVAGRPQFEESEEAAPKDGS